MTERGDAAATILTGSYREPQKSGSHLGRGRYRASDTNRGSRTVLAGKVIITHKSNTFKPVKYDCNRDLLESLRHRRYRGVASTSTVPGELHRTVLPCTHTCETRVKPMSRESRTGLSDWPVTALMLTCYIHGIWCITRN